MSQTSKGNGVQYSSFHKQQLLPLTITAGLDWVLDVIGNRITGISDEGASVTKCDPEVQLRGMTYINTLISFLSLSLCHFVCLFICLSLCLSLIPVVIRTCPWLMDRI